MDKKVIKSNAALLLAAMIWGLAFVAQSDGMNYIGPFTFGAIRCFLGAAVLVPVYLIIQKKNGAANDENAREIRKTTFKAGLLCGAILFGATSTQQIGLQYTAAGKAGFITALYIVLVPVFGMIFFKKKASWRTWISVAIATAGLYLLCIKEGFTIDKGDIWVIACALIFTFHILTIDKFADRIDGTLLSIVQFATVSVLSVPFIFINREQVTLSSVTGAWVSLLYTGILSCGVGYTMQIIGQKDAKNPAIASLLMSMESVFAVIFGWLILHEKLSGREFAGVVLMSAAIVLSQLPAGSGKRKKTGAGELAAAGEATD
ncbi:MAG: DMT family transporter [Oscillospiraceae bacterium]|nr:DMT family transporter [Oscillospiraceae bacterium]